MMRDAKSLQLCLTLCDPMDCSLPGSSVHGIFQAIVLEWIAIAFSKEMFLSTWKDAHCHLQGACYLFGNVDKRMNRYGDSAFGGGSHWSP